VQVDLERVTYLVRAAARRDAVICRHRRILETLDRRR
jgi:hypothetical protein